MIELNYQPVLPAKRDYGIGICGAGGIVNDAHLPAYRKAGFRVVGIYDRDREKAQRTAAHFEIDKVYSSLEELAGDPRVQLVDVAVPATENLGVVEAVAGAGKALLIQKPLAENLETARRTVQVLERHQVLAAVNQQMRWEPGVRACRDLMDQGLLGEVFNIALLIFVDTPWHLWGWLKQKPTIEVLYHSIHYLDTIRFLTGAEPRRLYADGSTCPGYDAKGETRVCLHLGFAGELRATVLTNHHVAFGLEGQQSELRVEGTEGAAIRRLGLLMNYPKGVADGFRFTSRRLGMGQWISAELEGSWFPDAFVGPISSLMRAMGGEIAAPETAVQDNLKTLELVFAAYASMREGRVVGLS
ncbi:MAG: Gfo/Idh/MocA family oxidoreductase [Candidatus Latescibacteria bacterium]|nr:Gfo/Idh/MocA family oxidoreductase [Candidatus Latescibacterota bacterium]